MSPRIEHLAEGKVILHPCDCLDVMRELAANSIDSCVTDPPYGLEFMGVAWDSFAEPKGGPRTRNEWEDFGSREHARNATSQARIALNKNKAFGKFSEAWAREVFRVLKPGAHLLSFGGTRTYHRMACAIEDAGFEIRDSLQWLYGSGFPKSHDVSKGIDKAAGVEREVVGSKLGLPGYADTATTGRMLPGQDTGAAKGYLDVTAPATNAAREWQGWGTALKPACEPIVLARKPLSESTVAANVLKWGTGALNIDGCRVATDEAIQSGAGRTGFGAERDDNYQLGTGRTYGNTSGRWPANVILDGSDEVVGAFPERHVNAPGSGGKSDFYGPYGARENVQSYEADGSAARFFYTAKADADDRIGSKHPTVKPVDLMQWLVRLVTPKGGLVLDPFAGTGTTGEAAFREGMRTILIEREEEYQDDIRRRMALVMSGPEERSRESIKAKTKDKPIDHGPLFGPAPAKQEVLGV